MSVIATPPPVYQEILDKYEFQCKRCDELYTYKDKDKHERECKFRVLKCPHKECGLEATLKDLREHWESDCLFT